MQGLYWLKFIGTTSMLSDYTAMMAATTINVNRFEMEVAVLAAHPDFDTEGESRIAFSGFLTASRKDRVTIDVKFWPFSNYLPVNVEAPINPDTFVPQNTNTLFQLRALFKNKSLWVTRPTTEGRYAPPRYEDTVNFPLVAGLLPLWIERDPFEMSLVEDDGETEVSLLLQSRKR